MLKGWVSDEANHLKRLDTREKERNKQTMKKEDLIALGVTEEQADKIFALHGKGIAKLQADAETAKTEAETLATQLTEANKQIESFKGMNIDQIKATADEYKTKFETAQTEHAAQLLKIKQDNALEKALKETYKVADLVAVKAHLKADGIKFNEKDDSFVGLEEQIKPLKETHGAYFTDDKTPVIVAGGQSHSVIGDPVINAVRQAAGLSVTK
jgi:hypothetical protein